MLTIALNRSDRPKAGRRRDAGAGVGETIATLRSLRTARNVSRLRTLYAAVRKLAKREGPFWSANLHSKGAGSQIAVVVLVLVAFPGQEVEDVMLHASQDLLGDAHVL